MNDVRISLGRLGSAIPQVNDSMDPEEAIERLATARHAYLATADGDGRPHLVPIVFVVSDGHIATAVDHKPKRSGYLKRHRNVAANSRVAVLADHYSERWEELWWVRAEGDATIVDMPEGRRWISQLQAKYPQYGDTPPNAPIIIVAIDRVSGWSGGPPPAE